MEGQSKTLPQMKLVNTNKYISSVVLESGYTHLKKLDGEIDQSGQEVVLANLSARQAKEKGLLMSGTYGQRGSI